MNKETLKLYMAIVSMMSAIIVGIVAMFIPPHGIIDASILWFTAQLLVFTSTLLGLSMTVDNIQQKISNRKQ